MAGGKYSGNNRRGEISIPVHCHPLIREFVEHVNEQQTTFAEISTRSGVGVDTMRFWRSRHMARIDLLDAALNALDLELAVVARGTRDKRARRRMAPATAMQGAAS
ncbi:MAG: hypothetical protein GC182_03000 [Rhodopseudomonas sp.]|nr:hypothetical protein [Rhodopseudomonas sp.]